MRLYIVVLLNSVVMFLHLLVLPSALLYLLAYVLGYQKNSIHIANSHATSGFAIGPSDRQLQVYFLNIMVNDISWNIAFIAFCCFFLFSFERLFYILSFSSCIIKEDEQSRCLIIITV